jgi:serpin B
VAILVVACGVDDPGQEVRAPAAARAAADPAARPGAVAVNGFGLDLHRAQARLGRGNLVVSPWAAALPIAMTRVGATGETRAQLDRALHVEDPATLDAGLNALDQSLSQRGGEQRSEMRKGTVDLEAARALWAPRGTEFLEPFLTTLASDYGTGVRVVDFRSDPEAARSAVNTWVAHSTDQAIPQIVPRGGISDVTRLLATSAFYPKAPWEVRFTDGSTRPLPFTVRDGQTVDPPTMQLATSEGLLHAASDDWQAVELPYLGQELALLVVMPSAGTLDAFTDQLDAVRLDAIVQSLQPGAIELRLPRFAFTTDVELNEALRQIGVTDLLDDGTAELGGITADEPLALSAARHQAFFSIDEEGTQARAATVHAATPEPVPAPATSERMVVDRPFVFALRDRETGLLLAIGRVVNPLG